MAWEPKVQKKSAWNPTPVEKSIFTKQQSSSQRDDGTNNSSPVGISKGHGFNLLNLKSPSPVQAKLTVGAPGDKYEQEADAMAAQVMSMPEPATSQPVQREMAPEEQEEEAVQTKPLADSITPLVQREVMPEEEIQTRPLSTSIQRDIFPEEEEVVQTKPALQRAGDGNFDASNTLESRLSGSKGGGSPLPDNVRGFMEPRFGNKFDNVRVHTGSEAVQMNKELGAQAFTHGSDIYYGAGKAPGNNELTAHELTHVVQQTGGVQANLIQCGLTTSGSSKSDDASVSEDRLEDINDWLHLLPMAERKQEEVITTTLKNTKEEPTVNNRNRGSVSLNQLNSKQKSIVEYIKKQRQSIDTSKFYLGKYKKNEQSQPQYGYAYNGNASSDPQPSAFQTMDQIRINQIRKAIWEELGNGEGGSSAINAYDPGIISWGRGFAFNNGQLPTILNTIFEDKAVAEAFRSYGIAYKEKQFLVVNTDNGGIERGNNALALIQGDKQLLGVFTKIAEADKTRQQITDAQYAQVDKYIGKPTATQQAWDNWPIESLQLAFHINHWGSKYGWETHPKEYVQDNPTGDALKIVMTFGRIAANKPEENGAFIVSWLPEQQILQFQKWGKGVGWEAISKVCPVPLPYTKQQIQAGSQSDFCEKIFIVAPNEAGYHILPSLPTSANAPGLGAKTNSKYYAYYYTLNGLQMTDMLKNIKAYATATAGVGGKKIYGVNAVEKLLEEYNQFIPDFGMRPKIALRAVAISLKGSKANQEERDSLLADAKAEFPKNKYDQYEAIEKLIVKTPKIQKASIEGSSSTIRETENSYLNLHYEQEAEQTADKIMKMKPEELIMNSTQALTRDLQRQISITQCIDATKLNDAELEQEYRKVLNQMNFLSDAESDANETYLKKLEEEIAKRNRDKQRQQKISSLLLRLESLAKAAATEKNGVDFQASVDEFKKYLGTRMNTLNADSALPHDLALIMQALLLWSTDPGNQWGEGIWDSKVLVMSASEYATIPANQYKCNAYVAEVIYRSLNLIFKAHEKKEQPGKYFPYQAREWGNSSLNIVNFPIVTTPQMGDIWSNGKHTGIYLGSYAAKKLYISARDDGSGVFGLNKFQQEHGIQIKYIPNGGVYRHYTR